MTPILIYFLKSAISLALFYSFYWFFLRKETFFRFNRYYFIGSMTSSLLLPLIDVSRLLSWNETVPVKTITDSYVSFQNAVITPVIYSAPAGEVQNRALSTGDYLLLIYSTGIALLLLRLIIQVTVLTIRIKRSKSIDIDGIKVISHKKVKSPFSFFSYVFINPEQFNDSNIGDVILHEKEHINQRHSIDLLFAELLTILQWPNPFAWLTKRSLIETHEYLADSAVLKKGVPVDKYQRTLISYMLGAGNPALVTPFNFSLNKKRLIMMNKIKSPALRKWRSILLLPLLSILLIAFSDPVQKNKMPIMKMKPASIVKDSSSVLQGDNGILIFLDGVRISNAQMKKIPPTDISKINVLKGDAAEKYGGDREKGVILIITNSTPKYHITGTVLDDATGKPIPAVSVIVYGTTQGRITDADGHFSLNTGKNPVKISFSYVGYESVITDIDAVEKPVIRLKKAITVISFDDMPEVKKPVQTNKPNARRNEPVFFVVEEMPEYPGGIKALHDYIVSELKYPAKAKKRNISGTVFVNFTVDKNGKVTNVYIDKNKSVDPLLDKEAVRVVSGMPDWKPGAQRNYPVPVQMSVPVTFEL